MAIGIQHATPNSDLLCLAKRAKGNNVINKKRRKKTR